MVSANRVVLDTLPSAAALGVPNIVYLDEAVSTMDVAHALAADGAPAGTVVIADCQTRGRGRSGKSWTSQTSAGLWMTLIERPHDQRVVGVLALRLGLAVAEALTPMVDLAPQVKWPNDVFVGAGKVAGILVEARWRDASVDWVAIGIGINLEVPTAYPDAAAVRAGTKRSVVLHAVLPLLRRAVARHGPLTADERVTWESRDLAQGRRISQPRIGRVIGINADGALLVATDANHAGEAVHAGSLVFENSEGAC